jgi:diguanylate cyclase (GGDEF)-like protein
LSQENPLESLIALLQKVGLRTAGSDAAHHEAGYPLALPLKEGGSIVLDLPEPALLSTFDTDHIGIAILDPVGYPRKLWGLAAKSELFSIAESCLDGELTGLVEAAYKGGSGTLYLNGLRYYAASIARGDLTEVLVLVINAQDEQKALRRASKSEREANTLRRLGKVLTMYQTMQQMCVAAVHEIASATELAAVLLWALDQEEDKLRLVANVGANRYGASILERLETHDAFTCIAELVAETRQPLYVANVNTHVMTAELEAKFCYLKPGGVSVHPLVINDKLLGVLELIGREGDTHFAENLDLYGTIAEHVALALNSACLFESFEKMATHDALTGVANHRTMQEFLHKRLMEAERSGQEIGLIMLDVDHFRSFNEEEGHDAGDQVLRLVVQALQDSIRPYDLAARYGGEEFTIIMPGSGKDQTMNVAERIRKKVEAISFVTRSGRERHVTVSLGCACFPHTANDPLSLLKAADTALFRAKKAGRNNVVFYRGKFEPKDAAEELDLTKVWQWVPAAQVEKARKRQDMLQPYIEQFSARLNLSKSQQQILCALVLVTPFYRKAAEAKNPKTLREMEAAEEFRLLLPSLTTLSERFDGQGPQGLSGSRIPLLCRALAVILELEQDQGQSLLADPGRFDPEIVALVAELDDAA